MRHMRWSKTKSENKFKTKSTISTNDKTIKASLPSFFSFKQVEDLERIGRNYDGGYLVSKSDIEKTDALIGLGINTDWSFEEDFLRRKKVDVYAYDASVNEKLFLTLFLKSLTRIHKPSLAKYYYSVLMGYRSFFGKKNVNHIQKFVGLNTENDTHCSFLEVLNKTKHKNVFLKIDIEGSEYRFLDDIISNKNRITGMVIEFHDCDIHIQKIKKFIKKFDLNLVHIHANNYAPLRLDDNLPLVLELTFSKFGKFSKNNNLPHNLDMPNDPNLSEIELLIRN